MMVVITASVLLLRPSPASQCEPLDPIPVVIGATHFAIPAVLLPALKPEEGVEFRREFESLTGNKFVSEAGTPLQWWYCADESGAPLRARGFTLHGKWVARAVDLGELDFVHLPYPSTIVVRMGQVLPETSEDVAAIPFFSNTFQATCGEPIVLPKTSEQEIISTRCSVPSVNLSADTVLWLRFWIQESDGFPIRNAPDKWPALARDVELWMRSVMAPRS